MLPLSNIRVKSAKMKKGKNGSLISAADPNTSYFKRDVPKIIDELNKTLDTAISVNEHFYSVLAKSEVGRNSSEGQHLICKRKKCVLNDHH